MRKFSALGKWGGLLNNEPNDEVSDTTGDAPEIIGAGYEKLELAK